MIDTNKAKSHTMPAKNYAVVCAYDSPFGQRGSIVSRHKSYELAAIACKNDGGFLKIVHVSELN